jgi:hypothetical protein
MLPMQVKCPQPVHCHTGSGVPQNRLREIAQSRASRSQFANRFSPTNSGTQRVCSFNATIRSRNSETFTNHVGIAL